jgi:hypothetical protein
MKTKSKIALDNIKETLRRLAYVRRNNWHRKTQIDMSEKDAWSMIVNECQNGCGLTRSDAETAASLCCSSPRMGLLSIWFAVNSFALVVALSAAIIAAGLTMGIWQHLPIPHHVVSKLGSHVISDYWTSSPYQTNLTGGEVFSLNGRFTGQSTITNITKLW